MSYITLTSPVHVAKGFDEEASRKLLFACTGWDLDAVAAGKGKGARLDENGMEQKIRECLKLRADPNVQAGYGNTPLIMLAMYGGHSGHASQLVDAGAKPDLPNNMRRTPYFVAIEAGNYSIGEFMQALGIDTMIRDTHGLTAAAERARMISANRYRPQA